MSERLNFLGLTNRRGVPIGRSTVRCILKNPAYTGIMRYKGEPYEGNYESIVSRATFEAVQKKLDEKGFEKRINRKHYYPYLGLLKCGECGCSITGQNATGHGGLYHYYRCTKKRGKCSQSYVRDDVLSHQLKKELRKVALPEEWESPTMARIDAMGAVASQSSDDTVKDMDGKIRIIQKKLEMLVTEYLDGKLEKDIYVKKKDELIREKKNMLELQCHIRSRRLNWIEPLKRWVRDACSVERLLEEKIPEQIRDFTKKIGTNRRLLARTLRLDFQKPYDLILKFNTFFAGKIKTLENFSSKNEPCAKWWRRLGYNRFSLALYGYLIANLTWI